MLLNPYRFGQPPFVVDGADFALTTGEKLTRGAGLTGAADSKTGILSVWLRVDSDTGSQVYLSGATALDGDTAKNPIDDQNLNRLKVQMQNAAGTVIVNFNTVGSGAGGALVTSAVWKHCLCSWDAAGGTGASKCYINDVSDIFSGTATNDTIDYTIPDWAVGSKPSSNLRFNGCMAELYFAPGQYLDFDVEANRRKFIRPDGKPEDPGSNGSVPTGTAPLIYMHLDGGETPNNFRLNRGTGGDFTLVGTLTTASSSPSD